MPSLPLSLIHIWIPLREEWTHLCTKNIQRAKDYLNTLYDKGISFDAVVTSDDSLAVGAVKYAYEHRIAIPEQLQIIGYNNSVLANCTEPELTSIDSKVEPVSYTHLCSSVGERPCDPP